MGERRGGKKGLYPSCHDAPVIVTDQIQCGVCACVQVCLCVHVCPVSVCDGFKLWSRAAVISIRLTVDVVSGFVRVA